MRKRYIFSIVFFLSVVIRLSLLFTTWDGLRHSTAIEYGSSAIGFYHKQGVSTNSSELKEIGLLKNNYTGNYLDYYDATNRQKFAEFLPGPAILLGSLWKIIPVYNFSPYIILQVLLDSSLITLFLFIFYKHEIKIIFIISTVFLIFNLPSIKQTLTMGYDFWPYFSVLIGFLGSYYGLKNNKLFILFITGLLMSIPVWFRAVTVYLPFFIILSIFIYERFINKKNIICILKQVAVFMIPYILLLGSLSELRYDQTGNYRPTRSTFWHSFFCGVGQFSNPYDLDMTDKSVHDYAVKKSGGTSILIGKYNSSNSNYELFLKEEGIGFIKEYPHLFIRNTLYRIAIMISPTFYRYGEFIPMNVIPYLYPIGFILIPIWFLGMFYLFKRYKLLFILSSGIYLYFFGIFGCFHVVGRVILSFLFINVIVYLFGIKYINNIIFGRFGISLINPFQKILFHK